MTKKVTGKVREELAAAEAERALLDFAVSQSPAIFYVAEISGKQPVRFISDNVETITGHKVSEFLSDATYGRGFIHPDDLDSYSAALKRLREEGRFSHEYRFRKPDGNYLWFRDELRLSGPDPKKPTEFVGCMIDITAEREAARRLEDAETLHDAITRTAMDAIVSADEEGVIIEFNPAAERMFGYRRDEAIGRSLAELIIPEKYRAQHNEGIRRFHETGKAGIVNRRVEVEALRADGSVFPVELTIAHAHLGDRDVFVGEIRDLTERKEIEASRDRLFSLLHDAVRTLPSGFAVTGPDGRFVLCNEAFAGPFGVSAAELTGRDKSTAFAELVSKVETFHGGEPLSGASGKDALHDRMMTGTMAPIELEWSDGGWALLSCTPTPDGGFVTVLTDVTDLKSTELRLRHSEEVIRLVVEGSPVPISMVRMSDAAVIYQSPAMSDLFGVPSDQRGAHVKDIGADPEEQKDVSRRVLREGSVDDYEMMFQRLNGSRFWGTISARLIDYHGEPAAVAVIADLTERRESEAIIRRMMEDGPAPLTMVDLGGTTIYESARQGEIFGFTKDSGRKTVTDFYADPGDRRRFLAELQRSGRLDDFRVRMKRVDGSEFEASIAARLIDYRGGRVIISMTTDLTEKLEVEAQMERQRETLHQREKLSALGEVLAGVAHELNNPLSVVVGQAMMLKDTAPDPKTAERARKIGDAADRCARIVKTFLAMARQKPTEAVPLDLNEVVESALEVTGYSLRASGIDIALRLDPDLPQVVGDASQLGQVLTNLIVNAQHALEDGGDGGRVEIATRYDPQQGVVKLIVQDNGSGISAEMRSRIFEPLFTTKSVGAGTGIGLALCHRIVESHGGKIKVYSEPGKGAVFTIRLPAALSAPCGVEAVDEAAANGSGVATLVIDDEPEVAELLSEILTASGCEVDTAGSGAEALRRIDRRRYDVILCDVRMPQMDGPAFYGMLAERDPALAARLAFVTGDTMSPRAQRFLESTERPYIEKPINPAEVRDLVDRIMREAGSAAE